MKKKSKKTNSELLLKSLHTAWGLGFVIVLPAILFAFLGIFLDKLFHTSPLLTIIFILLGPVVGFSIAIKEIKKIIH